MGLNLTTNAAGHWMAPLLRVCGDGAYPVRAGARRNTIKKALDVLKSENLIETAPGRGLFVKRQPDE